MDNLEIRREPDELKSGPPPPLIFGKRTEVTGNEHKSQRVGGAP
jgi:hypothetical protein